MADIQQQAQEKIDAFAHALQDGLLEQWNKTSKAFSELPKDFSKYQEIATNLLKDEKATITDSAGKTIDVTGDAINSALADLKKTSSDTYNSVVNNLQKAGLVKTEGQLTPSQEKGREAYETTKNMVTEQLAVKLKDKGNLFLLGVLTENTIKIPDDSDNASYRKISNDLIEKREFTATLVDGTTKTITIADLDKALAERAASDDKDKQKQAKDIKGIIGAENFDAAIPDQSKRHEIARSVQGAVEENTGNIKWLGGASIMNALMGLIMWIIGGFDGGFDGLRKSIADETAKSIGHDTKLRLSGANTGLNADIIDKIAMGAQAKAMEKAGYSADVKAPVLPTLETTHLPTDLLGSETLPAAAPAKPVAEKVQAPAPKKDDKKTESIPHSQASQPIPKKDEKKADSSPHSSESRGSETDKLIDNISSKILASAKLTAPVSDKSIKDLKDVLVEQFKNNADVKTALKAGDYDKLSGTLTGALINDDRSYNAIKEAMGKSSDGAAIAAAKSPSKWLFKTAAGGNIEAAIKEQLAKNGQALQSAVEKDSKIAFNDLVSKDSLKLAYADVPKNQDQYVPNGPSGAGGVVARS